MTLLELRQVSKGYGSNRERTEVLSNINLSIAEGEFVAIVGYSGAGKTTLMALLAGLIHPDVGCVELEGHSVEGPGPDRGLVFQNYSLLPWLSVFENVKLAVDQVFSGASDAERIKRTNDFVHLVNLTPARDKFPSELSGGMRQRVSVARTLAMQPKVLLCDEPFSALDALTRANLQDELTRISGIQKQTVVMVTNDPDEAILLADRVIPLTRGPKATLGPSIPVTLPRPRDRKQLNSNAEFKRIRNQIINYLLQAGERTTGTEKLLPTLPNLEPEDLTNHRDWFGRGLKRKKELARSA